jgi:hypothetical protein
LLAPPGVETEQDVAAVGVGVALPLAPLAAPRSGVAGAAPDVAPLDDAPPADAVPTDVPPALPVAVRVPEPAFEL